MKQWHDMVDRRSLRSDWDSGIVQNPEENEAEIDGIKDTVRLIMFPLAKNRIIIRLENIADKFSHPDDPPADIDLRRYLDRLWKKANKHGR